ncbi:unnamed protein product [Gordionus sp. m RMFG-2023]
MKELTLNQYENKYSAGDKLAEGKTKIIYNVIQEDGTKSNEHLLSSLIYITSKDRITANNALRSDIIEGKASISNSTNCLIFQLLNSLGVATHFVRQIEQNSFIAKKCKMIPIEWVVRRIATGSYLKRHPHVPEGYIFSDLKMETFFKDDAKGDPQISEEEIICSNDFMAYSDDKNLEQTSIKEISRHKRLMYNTIKKQTILVFEILEKIWRVYFNVTLVDMKVEFGIDSSTGEILLADVIDNDSWRLWPQGDKTLMVDKQVYRDLSSVDDTKLKMVKANYQWVLDTLMTFKTEPMPVILIMIASPTDLTHAHAIKSKISKALHSDIDKRPVENWNPVSRVDVRMASAHKGTAEVLTILKEYEALQVPLIIIACAGGSNGLGPVIAGNTPFPVINCPPFPAGSNDLIMDIWSSLRTPSGMTCPTVISPEAGALAALSSLACYRPIIWCHLRANQIANQICTMNNDDKLLNQ